MTATSPATQSWETRDYARIIFARFRAPTLFVTFADGSEVGVAVERFDNPTIRAHAPDWSRARAAIHEVLVPTASGEVGIPWDSIRAMADPVFAAHRQGMASPVARAVGARVRGWREEQRLDPAALGQRAGVPAETVAGVEAGWHWGRPRRARPPPCRARARHVRTDRRGRGGRRRARRKRLTADRRTGMRRHT